MIMNKPKRNLAILIPYKKNGDSLEVYLQKRSPEQVLPNYFGFWGGGFEDGETAEMAVAREIKEELGLDLDFTKVQFFGRYEFLRNIQSIFLMEVVDGWEKDVVIGEGEYGQWLMLEEAFLSPIIIYENKVVLNDLERQMLNKPIR